MNFEDYSINSYYEYQSITEALRYLVDWNSQYKGSSTKKGNNPKAIKARRKKNKNKKTHRK